MWPSLTWTANYPPLLKSTSNYPIVFLKKDIFYRDMGGTFKEGMVAGHASNGTGEERPFSPLEGLALCTSQNQSLHILKGFLKGFLEAS